MRQPPRARTSWTPSSPWAIAAGGSFRRAAVAGEVLLDYFPGIEVIVGAGDRVRAVAIAELLPETYVWADHQLDAD